MITVQTISRSSPISANELHPSRRAGTLAAAISNDLLLGWDLAAMFISGYISMLLQQRFFAGTAQGTSFFHTSYGHVTALCMLLAPFVLRIRGIDVSNPAIFRRLTLNMLLLAGLVIAIGFLTQLFGVISRAWTVMFLAMAWLMAGLGRVFARSHLRRMQERGALRERVAIIGSGPSAERFADHLRQVMGNRIEIMGLFDPDPLNSGGCTLDNLVELGKRHGLDWAVIADCAMPEQQMENVVSQMKALDLSVAMAPPLMGRAARWESSSSLGNMPLLVLADRPINNWGLVLKTLEDKILGGLLLLAVAPVMLIITVLIKLDSPGPVLFRQRRHGWNNTEFDVLKFRTMVWNGGAASDKLQQTRRNDARITRLGRFLRASSLDELPQLLNVLRGDMSLVGPRPHPVIMRTEDRLGSEITAEYAHRHRVKPGITGWAQINGSRGATDTVEQVLRRVQFDNQYIEGWSILLDIKILLLTPLRLLFDPNAF